MTRLPPHPVRPSASPPSPAGGEGLERDTTDEVEDLSVTDGSRHRGRDPSPLVGEGGPARSAGSGEGAEKRQKKTKRTVPERIAFARRLRREATPAEKVLWRLLRTPLFNAARFRRQVPLGPFVADFLSYSARLVIEADGSQHDPDGRDRRRDAWFAAQGWQVLRFANREVTHNRQGVVEAIRIALRDRGVEP
ncbi:MAG: DUF559 domain-containing protein [Hyphomicrobiales bacterium]|nr:DUF559 domain-containing protein [Hyphomicrobiales bacterium]